MSDVRSSFPEHFFRDVIAEYRMEYAETIQTWRDLDSKGQATLTATATLLGVLYFFVREITPRMTWVHRALLGGAVVAFWSGVVCALLSLLVQRVRPPMRAKHLERLYADLRDLDPSEQEDRYVGFLGDQRVMWDAALRSHLTIYRTKAQRLRWAQVFLVCGLTLLAWMTLLIVQGFPNR